MQDVLYFKKAEEYQLVNEEELKLSEDKIQRMCKQIIQNI